MCVLSLKSNALSIGLFRDQLYNICTWFSHDIINHQSSCKIHIFFMLNWCTLSMKPDFCINIKISINRRKNVFIFLLVWYRHLHFNFVTIQTFCEQVRFEAFTVAECSEVFSGAQLCENCIVISASIITAGQPRRTALLYLVWECTQSFYHCCSKCILMLYFILFSDITCKQVFINDFIYVKYYVFYKMWSVVFTWKWCTTLKPIVNCK
jgi:hypothetical protein